MSMNNSCIKDCFLDMIKPFLEPGEEWQLDDLIFTTFNFSPDFLENNVLCRAADLQKINSAVDIATVNELFKSTAVSVFYDASALCDHEKRLTYDTYQVAQTNGVFHPKVIIAHGRIRDREQCHMMVMSANLTVSGWGRNLEVAAHTEVDARTAFDLYKFLAMTFECGQCQGKHESLLAYLQGVGHRGSGDTAFISSYSEQSTLRDYICQSNPQQLTVLSPYFDEDLYAYITNNYPADMALTIVPATKGDRVGITRSSYLKLRDRVKFKRFKGENQERFLHAKVFIADDYVIVGSHNFTSMGAGTAGPNQGNAEASLVLPRKGWYPELEDFADIEKACLSDDDEKWQEEEQVYRKVRVTCTVTADWRALEYSVKVNGWETSIQKDLKIHLPGLKLVAVTEPELTIRLTAESETALVKRKIFELFDGPDLIQTGFINEFKWQEYRPEGRYFNLEDCLSSWAERLDVPETGGVMSESRRIRYCCNTDEDEEEILFSKQVGGRDVFDNLFYLFKAFEGMDLAIEKSMNNIGDLHRKFCIIPGSLEEISKKLKEEALTAETPFEKVRNWLAVNELQLIMNKLRDRVLQFHTDQLPYDFLEKATNVIDQLQQDAARYPGEEDRFKQWITQELGYKTKECIQ